MEPDDHLEIAELSESSWSHNAVAAAGPSLLVLLPVLALAKLLRKLRRRDSSIAFDEVRGRAGTVPI